MSVFSSPGAVSTRRGWNHPEGGQDRAEAWTVSGGRTRDGVRDAFPAARAGAAGRYPAVERTITAGPTPEEAFSRGLGRLPAEMELRVRPRPAEHSSRSDRPRGPTRPRGCLHGYTAPPNLGQSGARIRPPRTAPAGEAAPAARSVFPGRAVRG